MNHQNEVQAEAELTEEHHEGGETSSVVAQSELRHDQVDAGGEEGPTQGRDKPQRPQGNFMWIFLPDLVECELPIKACEIPSEGDHHLA